MTKVMIYGRALNPSSQIHAYETMVPLSQAACVAYDCSLLRNLRSCYRFRSARAKGQVVRECRVSKDDHFVLHAMVDLANPALSAGECIILEVRRRVALVVVRASQHS